MVRTALALIVVVAGACAPLERALSGLSVNTPYGGGVLGIDAQRERAERNLTGWGGRPLGGIGAQRNGPERYYYGSP